MKKTKLFLLFFFAIFCGGCSYNYKIKDEPLSIQYIRISDLSLHQYIGRYIRVAENNNNLFKSGLGFVVLENINYLMNSGRPSSRFQISLLDSIEKNSSMNISIQAYPLVVNERTDCIRCNYFPPYYTVISDKLVLIYENNISGLNGVKYKNDLHNTHVYKKNSMSKLSKIVAQKSIKPLPNDYIFEDFIEKGIKLSTIKAKANTEYDIVKYYEFIDFKAKEKIIFNSDENVWKAER